MPSVQWLRGESVTQSTCGYISILTNGLLMLLIHFKSPSKLGNYKWLMLYTSLFELIYAFLTLFAGPHVHIFGSAFIVFQDMNNYIYGHRIGQLLIWVYCSCFGFSMAMFAGHFIYRYSTINLDFRRKYLSGTRQLFPFLFPLTCSFIWGFLCYFCYDETPQRSSYLRETLIENYRVEIDNCAYISAHFWPLDHFGNRIADFRSFFGVAIMQTIVACFIIAYKSSSSEYLISGRFIVLCSVFGVKCYLWISRKLKSIGTLSDGSRHLQNQLLQALVIQTMIPFVLMYIPAAMVFIFPMLSIELNFKYPIITHAVAIYPAIDPLPTILIIKSYRRGLIELFQMLACRGKFQVKGLSNWKNNTVNPVSFTASS